MEEQELIKYLLQTNDPDYQLVKACEELSELTTALLQFRGKEFHKPKRQVFSQSLVDKYVKEYAVEEVAA